MYQNLSKCDLLWVLTVPMRNGNYFRGRKYLPGAGVLTVPMRNGNIFFVVPVTSAGMRSYRTYEEWKL